MYYEQETSNIFHAGSANHDVHLQNFAKGIHACALNNLIFYFKRTISLREFGFISSLNVCHMIVQGIRKNKNKWLNLLSNSVG